MATNANRKRETPKRPKGSVQQCSKKPRTTERSDFYLVVAQRYDKTTLEYVSVGTLKLWLVKSPTNENMLVLLGNQDNKQISFATLHDSFQFRGKGSNCCTYEDARKIQWHLCFKNSKDKEEVSGSVAFFKAKDNDFQTPVTQQLATRPDLNSTVDSQSLLRISYTIYSIDQNGIFDEILLNKDDVWVEMDQKGIIPQLWQENLKDLSHLGKFVTISATSEVRSLIESDIYSYVASVVELHEKKRKIDEGVTITEKETRNLKASGTEDKASGTKNGADGANQRKHGGNEELEGNEKNFGVVQEVNRVDKNTTATVNQSKLGLNERASSSQEPLDMNNLENTAIQTQFQTTDMGTFLMGIDEKLAILLDQNSSPNGTQTKMDGNSHKCSSFQEKMEQLEVPKSPNNEEQTMLKRIDPCIENITTPLPENKYPNPTSRCEDVIPVQKVDHLLFEAYKAVLEDIPDNQKTFSALEVHLKIGHLVHDVMKNIQKAVKDN